MPANACRKTVCNQKRQGLQRNLVRYCDVQGYCIIHASTFWFESSLLIRQFRVNPNFYPNPKHS